MFSAPLRRRVNITSAKSLLLTLSPSNVCPPPPLPPCSPPPAAAFPARCSAPPFPAALPGPLPAAFLTLPTPATFVGASPVGVVKARFSSMLWEKRWFWQ
ncbi:MAG: hypothetical protein FJ020_07785 [Chloroflexi bacterium]|nr:hypothetical protein [Chloroflexota bacterium]